MEFKRGSLKGDGKLLLTQGWTVLRIAELYNVSRQTIWTYNKTLWKVPLKKQMTEGQEKIAKEMIMQGYTYKQIESKIGFKASSIADRNYTYWRLPYFKIQAEKKLVERSCEVCGKIFYVRKLKLEHDACRFCSKKCSHIGAVKPEKMVSPIFRGYGWAYLSLKLRKKIPFCQRCGKINEGLCVHHIKSWRLGGTNEVDNLIVLCNSCHRYVETGTNELFDVLGIEDAVSIIKKIYRNRLENLIWNLKK